MQNLNNPFYERAVNNLMALAEFGFKAEPMKKGGVKIKVDQAFLDMMQAEEREAREGGNAFAKAITRTINRGNDVERLAFEADPSSNAKYGSLYRQKNRLIPDKLLKRIAIQDELVAAIVQARQNQMAAFGRPRPDRFSNGFVIELRQEANEAIEQIQDQKEKQERKRDYQKRIAAVTKRLMTCGDQGMDLGGNQDKLTFPQYISMSVRNAIVCGRVATEVVKHQDEAKSFAGIRVVDAGTIYRALPQRSATEALRRQAMIQLEQLKGEKLDVERYMRDDYTWVQVIDDRPVQAFADDELLVHNFYPVPDVELDGYPVTPLDTVIQAVTTHINIGTHNKLYFQSGRAARGMLLVQSDDVDDNVLSAVRQQFNAQVNSVSNAWRMPVFGVGKDDQISWQPIDSGGRDMEFQYLADMNARVIMSAFLMSPDELPGWAYLSRGTNNQSLSECLAPQARITTSFGLVSIGDFVGDAQERGGRFWTGVNWAAGRAFRSGTKQLQETELDCGVVLKTSPDHRFLVVGPDGEPVWRHQSELVVGDVALVNRRPVPGNEELVPSFRGQKLTVEMAEVLGWMTGDGCLVAPRPRSGAKLHLFYHHEKERDVWERHDGYLRAFGVNNCHEEVRVSDEDRAKACSRYGFSSVASTRLRNTIYDTEFFRWLEGLGFRSSEDGKVVPAVFHALPVEYRQAFLRGLFSADGGKLNATGSVALTCQNDVLRDQVRQLLLGLGIRTLPCRGYGRDSGFENGGKTFSYKLFIKDRRSFWEQVGFVQRYKQAEGLVERWQLGNPPRTVIERYLTPLIGSVSWSALSKSQRDNARSVAQLKRPCSWGRLVELVRLCGGDAPAWMEDYHPEPVAELRDTGTSVEMFDVEIFDNTHAFVAEGVVTHNSNNEYKLEAARDVGIRPLLAQFEDFLNQAVLPLFDAELAKECVIKLVGLDSETQEKESTRLQQDQPVHMTYDEVLAKVEKKAVGKRLGGEFPLNPMYQAVLDKYVPVGVILEEFFGMAGASKDPQWGYVRDPFWFQFMQMQQQAQLAQQQAQQQAAGGAPGDGGEGGGGGGGDGPPQDDTGQGEAAKPDREQVQTENEKSANAAEASASPELSSAVNQALGALSKAERLDPGRKRLIQGQQKLIRDLLSGWEQDAAAAARSISAEAHRALKPKVKA